MKKRDSDYQSNSPGSRQKHGPHRRGPRPYGWPHPGFHGNNFLAFLYLFTSYVSISKQDFPSFFT